MQSPKTGMDFNGQVRWKGIFWYEKELRSPPEGQNSSRAYITDKIHFKFHFGACYISHATNVKLQCFYFMILRFPRCSVVHLR